MYTEARRAVLNVHATSWMPEKEEMYKNEQEKRTVEKENKRLEEYSKIFFIEHPMPESFAEKGGTLKEWGKLYPEVQEYEIHGGMEVEFDPMKLAFFGGLNMARIVGVKGVSLLLEKGKAFLSGIAEELIPISRKDALDFVRYAKNKTEGWTKKSTEFFQDTFSPNGRTNEGFDMPQPQGGMKNEMVAKDTLRRGEVAQHRIERADILARMEPLDQNMNELKEKIDQIAKVDRKKARILKNQAVIIVRKVIDNSDRLVQRFTGFQREIERGKYDPEGVKEILEEFRKTGEKLEEIQQMIERDTLGENQKIIRVFDKIQKSYKKRKEFYDKIQKSIQ